MAKLYRDHRCEECGADVPADLKMVNSLHNQHCSLHPSNVVEIDFKRLEPPGARATCPICLRGVVRASAFEDEDGWPWAVHWDCRAQYEYRWAYRRGREAKRAKAEEKAKRDAQKPPTPPTPASEAAARRLRGRLAANTRWARTEDRRAAMQPARDGWQRKFEREVDPNNELTPQERAKRAEYARKAYYQRLALKSVQARQRRKQR